jgi:hypothetical protein
MNKINVASLFSCSTGDNNKPFGTDTLIVNDERTSIKHEIHSIFQMEKDRRERKVKLYKRVLRNCLEVIKKKTKVRETHVMFEVGKYMLGENIYDYEECMEYMVVVLRKNHFDVIVIDDNVLFIYWRFSNFYRT